MRRTLAKFWKAWRSPRLKYAWHRRHQRGLTLIELLVSSVLISVVILVAWSGLISLMNMSAVSEAKGMRELELNQALDFLSAEIRMARRVNATAIGQLSPSTSIEDLLRNDGFDLTRLGNYGDLVLYLEIPTTSPVPAICPVGGPNAGAPPPFPSDFDQVIYDVRPSPSEWLSPKVTMRYGRVKDESGTFNPCANPVGSDPVADALSDDVANVPSCPGVLTGGPGFYACQEQTQANLLLQNKLVDDSVQQTSIVATPRLETIQVPAVADIGCQNESNLGTRNSQIPVPHSFYNQRSTDINQYILDATGQRQSHGIIEAGAQVDGTTHMDSVWVFTDTQGTCLQIATPKNANSTFTVVLPPEDIAGGSLPQPPEPPAISDPPPNHPDPLPTPIIDPLPNHPAALSGAVSAPGSEIDGGTHESDLSPDSPEHEVDSSVDEDDPFEQNFTFEQRSGFSSSPSVN